MRRLTAGVLALVAACASAGAPPGGPEDHEPPQILAISPDSGATNVNIRQVQFTFDEVVSDRPASAAGALDGIFLISPRNGAAQVSWRRSRITLKPRNGFRPNTAYRITMLPGLADLRGNVLREAKTIVFSTGPTFPPYSIHGRVFDWAAQRAATGAYIEAIFAKDTSLVYITATDTTGIFDVGPLNAGTYIVRALIDQNSNRTVDRNEKWDTTTVEVTDSRPSVELDAIERDSMPATIDNVTLIDSVTLRVTFDKPLDPALPLQPALIRLQRADSSQIEVTKVEWQAAFDRSRATRDSVRRADSTRARIDSARSRADTTRPQQPPPSVSQTPSGNRPPPPPAKPKELPPERGVIITVSPATPLQPSTTYKITARGFRNLVGHSSTVARTFVTARPPSPPAVRDTTRRPPGAPPPLDHRMIR